MPGLPRTLTWHNKVGGWVGKPVGNLTLGCRSTTLSFVSYVAALLLNPAVVLLLTPLDPPSLPSSGELTTLENLSIIQVRRLVAELSQRGDIDRKAWKEALGTIAGCSPVFAERWFNALAAHTTKVPLPCSSPRT